MSSAENVRSTIYLEPDLHQALRLKSASSRKSMSEIINDALREALREDESDLATARARAKEKSLSYDDFLAKLKADGTI